MSASKIQSKFERLPIKKQHFEIWIDFLGADLTREKNTFKLGSSLVAPVLIIFFLSFDVCHFLGCEQSQKLLIFVVVLFCCCRVFQIYNTYFDFISFSSFCFQCNIVSVWFVLNNVIFTLNHTTHNGPFLYYVRI